MYQMMAIYAKLVVWNRYDETVSLEMRMQYVDGDEQKR
jgi:hypothetical protein